MNFVLAFVFDINSRRVISQLQSFQSAGHYKTLIDLKHRNKALWNGTYGGEIMRIPTGKDSNVYAFIREKEGDKVFVIINLSPEAQDMKISAEEAIGNYSNIFLNASHNIEKDTELRLDSWEYLVLSSK